jgi:hypothetical protein
LSYGQEYSPDANTVALYHCDETTGTLVSDVSGNGNHGTAHSSLIADGKFGLGRTCTKDNSNYGILAPSSSSLDIHGTGSGAALTLEAYVNLMVYDPSGLEIIQKDGQYALTLGSYGSTGKLQLQLWSPSGPPSRVFQSTDNVPLGRWIHVAATWDGATAKLYVDGSLVHTETGAWEIASSSGQLRIGDHFGADQNPSESTVVVDEVRISNIARQFQGSAIEGDSLFFTSGALASCDSDFIQQSVKVDLSRPAVGGVVTPKIPIGVDYKGINTTGLITNLWDKMLGFPHNLGTDSAYVIVQISNTLGLRLPADTATLFNIELSSLRLCRQDKYIHWDTAQSASPSRRTAFTDTLFATFYPSFDRSIDSTKIQGFEPGDVDNSGGVDISDLSYLIDYLYISFTPCCLLSAADVSPDGNIDISDLSRLIDYLYISFNPLQCPSLTAHRPSSDTERGGYSLSALIVDGHTLLSLHALNHVRGVQIELSGPAGESPMSQLAEGIKMYSGWKDGVLRIGLIDPTGRQSIPSGNTPLLRLNGEFKILSATLASAEHQSIRPQINSSAATIPAEFALSQNYPNPFNPATVISYSLPKASDVVLKVYNALGQEVMTLVNGHEEAGDHTATWNASEAASGVYFYRLTAGDYTQSRKMLLMK